MSRFLTTLLLLLLLAGCDKPGHDANVAGGHNHTEGEEHDHSGDDEHVDRSQHLIHFNDTDELYLQYETLVARRDSIFLAHFTDLSDYTPIPDGFITIKLSGGGLPDETFSGKRPVRAGIHIEVALPQHAGERQLTLQLHSPAMATTHELGTVTVYPSYEASKNVAPPVTPANAIYLEKEAQWQAGFMIQRPTVNTQQQLTLPATAIDTNHDEHFIYLMQGAEFFERRQVTTEGQHHGEVVITQGVTLDDRIVVLGARTLFTGDEAAALKSESTPEDGHSHKH